MIDLNYIIFFTCTLFAIVAVEKLEEEILKRSLLKKYYIEEVEKIEKELDEYCVYSILAIAMKDKEAYEGYQSLINEKYWPFFFRKILLTTSLFFVLLSPYMLLADYLLRSTIPGAFSWVIFTAVAFFTVRLGYEFIKESVGAWMATRRTRG